MTQTLLAMSPDEHECLDFKENIDPLRTEYMSAMANAAALSGDDHATVLVGVGERKDPTTGATSGYLVGLPGNLHKAAEAIANRSSAIKPTPARVLVFEENVGSAKPILRVEITPTAPPHYDEAGRRSTRQHMTTRAMSDIEILELLEAREQRQFAAVAEETANLMMGQFRVVSEDLEDSLERRESGTAKGIDELVEWFDDRSDELWARLDNIESRLDQLPDFIDPSDPDSMEHIAGALLGARQMGLAMLAMRIADLGDRHIDAIDLVANAPADPLQYDQNLRELRAWRHLQERVMDHAATAEILASVENVVAAHDGSETASVLSLRDVAKGLRI